MSAELGPRVGNIYITTDGLNGYAKKAIELARDEIRSETAGLEEKDFGLESIVDGLEQVLDSEPGTDIVRRNKARGQFLRGAVIPGGANVEAPIDGLIFVDAEELEEDGHYSGVNVSKWTSKVRYLDYEFGGRNLRELITDLTLNTDASSRSGVPISRDTEVMLLNPIEAEENYFYGHDQDRRAVSGLELPDETLQGLLISVLDAYHVAGQSGYQDLVTARIRSAIVQKILY